MQIRHIAEDLKLNLDGIEILNLRNDSQNERRHRYARLFAQKMERKGYTPQEAEDKMYERNYFGMMMVETGEADAFITGEMSYHEYFGHEQEIQICVIGHYQSEQFTGEIFRSIIQENFPDAKCCISEINTNPILYL